VFGAYLRGQLLLSLIVGVAATIALLFLGVPYAFVLGVFAGMAELIPMLGPILGAVPAVLVALFQPFPLVLWVGLAFLVIQQLESNLLVPRISGHAVGLHPLAAMLALLVGFELAGVVGALFAVPIAGIVWVFAATALRARSA
jgi:predicted PurR-regulated permease PerM